MPAAETQQPGQAWGIVLDRAALTRLDGLLVTIRPRGETFRDPPWDHRVRVWWTEGKDEHWAGTLPGRDHTTAHVPPDRVRRSDAFRLLEAEVLIDLDELERESRFTEKGRTSLPYGMFRNTAFRTLSHELLHVVQAWVEGGTGFALRYASEWLQGQFSVRESSHSVLDWQRGYETVMLEKSAFAYGRRMIDQHAEALDLGAFDDLLPIDRIRQRIAAFKG